MSVFRLSVLLLCVLVAPRAGAKPMSAEEVPEPLKPWIPWVLHGQEAQRCPFLYNNPDKHHCAWAGRLQLELAAGGGSFSQIWSLNAEAWVPLPGDRRHWPPAVTA